MADDGLFDGPCPVCGESVKHKPYVSLALFGVFCEANDGLLFTPQGLEPYEAESWDDVPHFRAVHFECLQLYFDGVLADIRHRRRLEAADDEQP